MNDTEKKEIKFEHKDHWDYRSDSFLVQVSRHSVGDSEYRSRDDGLNRWCIYAYIYPKHPMFKMINTPNFSFWAHPISILPFHRGCTFHRLCFGDDLTITAVQIGCDYNHLDDDYYTQIDGKNAQCFLRDAEQLIEKLKLISDNPNLLEVDE